MGCAQNTIVLASSSISSAPLRAAGARIAPISSEAVTARERAA
jgi:hypothetical protein